MSQRSNISNFIIHDSNGQPQMVKVVQNSPKPLGHVVAHCKIKPSPVKVYSAPQTPSLFQTVKLTTAKGTSQVVKLPISALTQLQTPVEVKTENETETNVVETEEYPEVPIVQSVPELVPIPNKQASQPSSSNSGNKRYISVATMSHSSRRRHDPDEPVPEYTTKRRKHADKVGKGLRHFSMKVCEKVRNKGFTSYNEVADELVAEFTAGKHGTVDSQQYDQKNIRRRVYDALNVLMAMNIISKDKKEIRWLGLPTNSIQECTSLEKEKTAKLESIHKKTQHLQDLILRHISFKSLIERNKEAEVKGVKPSASSAIHLPFIVVDTSEDALIDCNISNDKMEYMFTFNKKFQINDDIDILKMMGLHFDLDKGECTEEDIAKAKRMVPKSLDYFVENMGRGVSTIQKLSDLLENDVEEDAEEEEEEVVEESAAAEDGDDDYSDGSSDVDV